MRNVRLRAAFYRATAADARLQAGFRQIFAKDLLAYINLCVWQFNPLKKVSKLGPFITWDFQEAVLLARPDRPYKLAVGQFEWRIDRGILWAYEHDKTTVVEKSREMGASWLFLIFQDWLCLFHDHTAVLNISRSADAVDDVSNLSLFWKLRFMHQYLPPWLGRDIEAQKMYFGFPNGAEITGEASTGRAGVGGRASVIFIDEFSKIKEDVEIRQRTASTADCRFFNSTHEGVGTEFYRMTQEQEINKITLHWSMHPEKKKGLYRVENGKQTVLDTSYVYPKDFEFVLTGSPTGGPYPGLRSPWYDKKAREIGNSRGVAVELDIDPSGSTKKVFDALVIAGLVREFCREPYWEGELEYDRDTGRPIRLVQRKGGHLRLWLHLRPDGRPPLGRYGVGADAATGVGATPSCFSVGSADTGDKVGEFADPTIPPDQYGALLVAVSWLFKSKEGDPAKLCWEARGPGDMVGKVVMELGFRHVYYRAPEVQGLKQPVSDIPGWVNTPNALQQIIDAYRSALVSRAFCNRSKLAMQETLMFEYTSQGRVVHGLQDSKDDPSGARANHADRVVADALCWKMVEDLGIVAAQPEPRVIPLLSLEWRRQWHREREADEAV